RKLLVRAQELSMGGFFGPCRQVSDCPGQRRSRYLDVGRWVALVERARCLLEMVILLARKLNLCEVCKNGWIIRTEVACPEKQLEGNRCIVQLFVSEFPEGVKQLRVRIARVCSEPRAGLRQATVERIEQCEASRYCPSKLVGTRLTAPKCWALV